MAQANPNAAVRASSGLGPKTFIYSIATGTITVEDACTAITTTFGGTIAGVEGTGNGDHVAQQGGLDASGTSGITLVATFDNN